MPAVPYLVVGGGMAGDAVVRGIRAVDPERPVVVLGAEPDPPYERPPLSKGLWLGKPEEEVWRRTAELPGVEVRTGVRAVALDPRAREVRDDRGERWVFGALALATGARPRTLPGAEAAADRVLAYRTWRDYRTLRAWAAEGRRLLLVGGGFIGSELAAALAQNHVPVTLLVPEDGLCRRILPADLGRFLVDVYRERGVDVRLGARAIGLAPTERGVAVALEGGERLEADGVVLGLGVDPATELAEQAGLRVDGGILVDETGRTDAPAIFATGDVAAFPAPALGQRLRVEHEDHANTHGTHVGRGMAGELAPYTHLPLFYSDLFEFGYEAVGRLDPERYGVVADWAEPFRKGVLYYLEGVRVRGVLLWNVWGQVDAARALLTDPGPWKPADLRGRIPLD